jgi:hypothetical protein
MDRHASGSMSKCTKAPAAHQLSPVSPISLSPNSIDSVLLNQCAEKMLAFERLAGSMA